MYPHHSGGQDQSTPPAYHYPPPPNPSQAPPPPPQQHQNGAVYPPASQPPTTLPSLSERYPQQPDMALHHPPPTGYPPQPPPGYPPQQGHYPPPYRTAHDAYRQGPPPPHGAHPYQYPPQPHQPAPRQRTAIACRYCRRRKIRCSGFDQSEDGRCANCQRFSQECVFTPVSAQTQAFVPVHAVYGRGGHSQTQLYGAYGQPLPPPQPGQPDPYAASRPPPQYTLPSPTGPHPGQHPHYQQPPPQQSHAPHYPPPPAQAPAPGYDDRNVVNGNRKRPSGEPHTPTIPPPNPATVTNGAHPDYRYPDPTTLGAPPVSPASSVSHQSGASASAPQPYYGSQPPQQRNSPPAAMAYAHENAARASASPNSITAGPSTTQYPPYPGEKLAPPSNRSDGRTPPPASTPGGTPTTATASAGGVTRPGMSISSIVSGDAASPGTRSAQDQNMLKRLGK